MKRILTLTLAGALATLLLVQTYRLASARRTLEEMNLHALSRSAGELQSLTLSLEKLMASSRSARQAQLLHAVSVQAGDAADALSALPGGDDLRETLRFLHALEAEADELLPLTTQSTLTETQLNALDADRHACALLSAQLSLAREQLLTGDADLSALRYPLAAEALPPAPRGLPEKQFSREEAREAALAFLGPEQVTDITPAPDASGVLPAYGFTARSGGVDLNLEVTRQGGKLLWMMPETASFPQTQTAQSCVAAGEAFLLARGFGDTEAVYCQVYDGLCVISAAPLMQGVLLYPDLITLQVRMDTLQVVGLEARSYWTNHVPRTLPEPLITQEAALAALSERVDGQSARLCLIPQGSGERLCWQCTALMDGDTYYIYIDAQTGEEAAIRKLAPLEQGAALA